MGGEQIMDSYTETLNDEKVDGYCNRKEILNCVHPLWDCTQCEYFVRTE